MFVRLTKLASFDSLDPLANAAINTIPSSMDSEYGMYPKQYIVHRKKDENPGFIAEAIPGAIFIGLGRGSYGLGRKIVSATNNFTRDNYNFINSEVKSPVSYVAAHAANAGAKLTGRTAALVPKAFGAGAMLYGGYKVLKGLGNLFSD